MISRFNNPKYFFAMISVVLLFGCSEQSETDQSAVPKSAVSEQTKAVEKKLTNAPKVELPKITLQSIPSSIDLDPCQLLTSEDLKEIGLPDKQHQVQVSGSRQLPNHSPVTPFVGCKWRSVDQGTPVGWVHIQQIKGEFNLEAEMQLGLGDGSWKHTYQGRDQLVVKTGDRLVMVVSQIPFNNQSEMDSNTWIAKKVLQRLEQVSDDTHLKAANASLVGGPSLDICKTSNKAKPHELLQGNEAWAFPNVIINHQASQKKRPQEDGVFCQYSSSRRGAIYVYFLGRDGVKRWQQHYEKNGEKVSFGGREAYRDRKDLYIPLAAGGIMVKAQGIKYFSDDEVIQKIDDIAKALLSQLN